MALTTVSVYKRVEGNGVGTGARLLVTPETEGFETTNVLYFAPSLCYAGNDICTPVQSKIVLKGVSGEKDATVTLYTSSTVAQIAALT